jgi:hypothetical protein
MRRLSLLVVSILFLSLGCASSIIDLTKNYQASSTAVREFATISAKDWKLGTGIIMGALGQDALPQWVSLEITRVNTWITDGPLDDYQLGYTVGLRLRLAAPVIRAAIQQYAPQLMSIKEVVAVMAFIGL